MSDPGISQGIASDSPVPTWERPRVLLRRMRSSCSGAHKVWKWSLPAWAGKLPDGRPYNTCPSAGECRKVCYARAGMFVMPGVLRAHQRNLQYVMDEPDAWQAQMTKELQLPRFRPTDGRPAHVRLHDSGDWWSDNYLSRWIEIARNTPDVVFYSYSKEVDRLKRIAEPDAPSNFIWRYSYGGLQDELIEPHDLHADVFPDEESLAAAGYTSQTPSDLLAAYGPAQLGITANNLPGQKKKQGDKSFRALQRAANARTAKRRHPRRGPAPRRPESP